MKIMKKVGKINSEISKNNIKRINETKKTEDVSRKNISKIIMKKK